MEGPDANGVTHTERVAVRLGRVVVVVMNSTATPLRASPDAPTSPRAAPVSRPCQSPTNNRAGRYGRTGHVRTLASVQLYTTPACCTPYIHSGARAGPNECPNYETAQHVRVERAAQPRGPRVVRCDCSIESQGTGATRAGCYSYLPYIHVKQSAVIVKTVSRSQLRYKKGYRSTFSARPGS